MLTLSYGYLKPQSGDKGSFFFPALEFDIQRLNDHTHDGTNSAKLNSASITVVTQAVPSASWVSFGGGFRQLVVVTGGGNYDDYFINFRITASGDQVYPTVQKASSTTYYVYTNDNSLDYTAVYTS